MRQTGWIRNYELVDAASFADFIIAIQPTAVVMIFSLLEIYPPRSIRMWIWPTTTGSSGRTFPGAKAVNTQALLVRYFSGAGKWSNLVAKSDKFV